MAAVNRGLSDCRSGARTLILVSSNWKRLALVGRTNTAGKSLVLGSTYTAEGSGEWVSHSGREHMEQQESMTYRKWLG